MKRFGKKLAFYLGTAWVIIEAFNFIIQQYDLDPGLINVVILIVLFGIPATTIYTFLRGTWNWRAVGLQVLNFIVAFAMIGYYMMNPASMNPESLRVLKVSKPAESALAELNAIAVLPFLNNMGEEQEYLVAGMHDGLITEIGRLGTIKVTSRTSVRPYEKSNKGIQEIAKELKVDALIETSLTKVDTLLSLQMKLVNAFPEERVLWSHSYEVHSGQLPNLYREVTNNIASKISDVVTPEQESKLTSVRTYDPRAYESFLHGIYHTGLLTPENFDKAEKYLTKAIDLDSTIVEAYTGLALLWVSKRQMGYIRPSLAIDTISKLLDIAEKLDPNNATFHAQKAVDYTWGTFEWDKARYHFQESIKQNPNLAEVRVSYAHFLMIMNEWDEAWKQAKYAEELDPDSPWVVSFVGIMYLFDGKVLTATKYISKLKRLQPDHPLLVEVNFEMAHTFGNYDEAIKYLKVLMERTQINGVQEFIDNTYADNDFKTTLTLLAQFLEEKRRETFVLPRLIGQLYTVTGNIEKQMEVIYLSFQENDPSFPYLGVKGGPGEAQNHPMYKALMVESGLWQEN